VQRLTVAAMPTEMARLRVVPQGTRALELTPGNQQGQFQIRPHLQGTGNRQSRV
jgi:hypothetical protein